MTARQRLPNRRMQLTEAFTWGERDWLVGIGFDAKGRAREAFVDGVKTGSDLGALVDDACILLSVMLQTGVPAEEIAGYLGREGIVGEPILKFDFDPPPGSLIGIVAERIHTIERDCGESIREAYAAAALRRQPQGQEP